MFTKAYYRTTRWRMRYWNTNLFLSKFSHIPRAATISFPRLTSNLAQYECIYNRSSLLNNSGDKYSVARCNYESKNPFQTSKRETHRICNELREELTWNVSLIRVKSSSSSLAPWKDNLRLRPSTRVRNRSKYFNQKKEKHLTFIR